MITPWIIAAVAVFVVLVLWLVLTYNGLVTAKQRFLNAFAQIDVQLKRRHDLIPNLVEAVKGYMAHERQTLEAVIAARNTAVAAQKAVSDKPGDTAAMRSLFGAESMLAGLLGQMMIRVEAYPELKAQQAVAALMEELVSTENRIAFARQAYNDSVMVYNTRRMSFPTNLVAGVLGFEPSAPLFEAANSERAAVAVNLGS